MKRHAAGLEARRERWRQEDAAVTLTDTERREVAELVESVGPYVEHLDDAWREKIGASFHWDMISEYDARFFSAFVRTLPLDFSEPFMSAERVWAHDEALHFEGLGGVCQRWFGGDTVDLAARRPEFGPLAHLFEDEFHICCLGAYDELVTVRAYRSVRDLYHRLGPSCARFVHRVIADEGRHYGKFLAIVRDEHGQRLGEAREAIRRIRAAEGTAYRATFVLDHDDDIFAEWMYDDAEQTLLRHLGVG